MFRPRFKGGLCRCAYLPALGLLLMGLSAQPPGAPGGPEQAAAPQALTADNPVFRAETRLVRVDAQVERDGSPLAGLTQSDFLIKDQGKPVEIVYFGAESTPLDLVLLIDVSGSMRNAVLEMVRTADTALQQLQSGDRVAIIAFTNGQALVQAFTDDRQKAQAALARLSERRMRGGTSLYPAIRQASAYAADPKSAAPGPSRRRAIIMVTDNLGRPERSLEPETIRSLWDADAVLHGLVIPVAGDFKLIDSLKLPGMSHREDIRRIVKETGGETIQMERVAVDFPAMLRRVRQRYTLHYRAPEASPGEFRKIETALTKDAKKRAGGKVVIRTRPGYFAR